MKKALICSIFTPTLMESKNILRFFGTLQVLLVEGKLPTKLITNFPSKKAFDLTMSHYSHCLVRMETDKH